MAIVSRGSSKDSSEDLMVTSHSLETIKKPSGMNMNSENVLVIPTESNFLDE